MTNERLPMLSMIMGAAALLPSITALAAAQSRAPADMPTAILEAQISRAASAAQPEWIVGISPDGHISGTGTLRELIQMAYRRNLLDRPFVEGGPGWIGSDRFSINLKAPGSDIVGDDGFPREAMARLQDLLAWRFGVSLHTDRRELPIYSLVLARADGAVGSELRKSDVDCAKAVALMIRGVRPPSTCGFQQYVGRPVSTVLTMADMASLFSGFLDRPVVDRTGLQGHFSATLDGIEVRPPKPFDPGYRPDNVGRMFMALTEQLGLKLEPAIAVVDVLVVDGAEDPKASETLPLVVEAKRVLPADPAKGGVPRFEVVVHNVSERTIVAAGIRTELKFADGFVYRSGQSADGVEFVSLPQRRPLVIAPDGRYTFWTVSWPSKRSEKDVVAITAVPTFVIFDDDTAIGDERHPVLFQGARRQSSCLACDRSNLRRCGRTQWELTRGACCSAGRDRSDRGRNDQEEPGVPVGADDALHESEVHPAR